MLKDNKLFFRIPKEKCTKTYMYIDGVVGMFKVSECLNEQNIAAKCMSAAAQGTKVSSAAFYLCWLV